MAPGTRSTIARALHAEFPEVTFDATIKVEHILERRALFRELADLGCAFVVSAVESLSDEVLRHLAKGHTRENVVDALGILHAAGIPMRPTFVTFTPWTTRQDLIELLDFVEDHDLIDHVDPVQYTIRLLVPPGSALLADPTAAEWLGPLDEAAFTYAWTHPDPAMDVLQRALVTQVEHEVAAGRSNDAIYAEVRRLTESTLGMRGRQSVAAGRPANPPRRRRPIPHLTESWFC